MWIGWKLLGTFGIFALGSAILTADRTADAAYRRVMGSSCPLFQTSTGAKFVISGYGTVSNTAANTWLEMTCPFTDDSTIGKTSVTGVAVDTYNSNGAPLNTGNSPAVLGCIQAYDQSGQTCTAPGWGETAGWNSQAVNLSDWTPSAYSSWYPSILVMLWGGNSLTGYLAYQ